MGRMLRQTVRRVGKIILQSWRHGRRGGVGRKVGRALRGRIYALSAILRRQIGSKEIQVYLYSPFYL
jgi:hypothetical protein